MPYTREMNELRDNLGCKVVSEVKILNMELFDDFKHACEGKDDDYLIEFLTYYKQKKIRFEEYYSILELIMREGYQKSIKVKLKKEKKDKVIKMAVTYTFVLYLKNQTDDKWVSLFEMSINTNHKKQSAQKMMSFEIIDKIFPQILKYLCYEYKSIVNKRETIEDGGVSLNLKGFYHFKEFNREFYLKKYNCRIIEAVVEYKIYKQFRTKVTDHIQEKFLKNQKQNLLKNKADGAAKLSGYIGYQIEIDVQFSSDNLYSATITHKNLIFIKLEIEARSLSETNAREATGLFYIEALFKKLFKTIFKYETQDYPNLEFKERRIKKTSTNLDQKRINSNVFDESNEDIYKARAQNYKSKNNNSTDLSTKNTDSKQTGSIEDIDKDYDFSETTSQIDSNHDCLGVDNIMNNLAGEAGGEIFQKNSFELTEINNRTDMLSISNFGGLIDNDESSKLVEKDRRIGYQNKNVFQKKSIKTQIRGAEIDDQSEKEMMNLKKESKFIQSCRNEKQNSTNKVGNNLFLKGFVEDSAVDTAEDYKTLENDSKRVGFFDPNRQNNSQNFNDETKSLKLKVKENLSSENWKFLVKQKYQIEFFQIEDEDQAILETYKKFILPEVINSRDKTYFLNINSEKDYEASKDELINYMKSKGVEIDHIISSIDPTNNFLTLNLFCNLNYSESTKIGTLQLKIKFHSELFTCDHLWLSYLKVLEYFNTSSPQQPLFILKTFTENNQVNENSNNDEYEEEDTFLTGNQNESLNYQPSLILVEESSFQKKPITKLNRSTSSKSFTSNKISDQDEEYQEQSTLIKAVEYEIDQYPENLLIDRFDINNKDDTTFMESALLSNKDSFQLSSNNSNTSDIIESEDQNSSTFLKSFEISNNSMNGSVINNNPRLNSNSNIDINSIPEDISGRITKQFKFIKMKEGEIKSEFPGLQSHFSLKINKIKYTNKGLEKLKKNEKKQIKRYCGHWVRDFDSKINSGDRLQNLVGNFEGISKTKIELIKMDNLHFQLVIQLYSITIEFHFQTVDDYKYEEDVNTALVLALLRFLAGKKILNKFIDIREDYSYEQEVT